ncbi:MAG TPA: DNA sulfur modification protein DndE [Pseudoxanthomonas sp.]|nr:DNA sulfur modification protein DndE [Pseudoxanthomonas sp.]
MMLDTLRLSSHAKEQLARLKRYTSIAHWNILCRWALCTSLADPSEPADSKIVGDSNIEITWRTFAGDLAEPLIDALSERCEAAGYVATPERLSHMQRLHVHRGLSMLSAGASIRSIVDLLGRTRALDADGNSRAA